MKAFSAIRKVRDEWVFDYQSDADPSDDLYTAGALVADDDIDETTPGAGLKNAKYSGSAYADPNTEAGLKEVQARLRELGWNLSPGE
jgi:hypothetical protein